jgi:anti-sigma28 factor (negative regulator of flagellin synthesis)
MTVNRKRILEVLEATPEVRKGKIAVLKKTITGGTYQVTADDIARKILKEWIRELVLTPNSREHPRSRNN